MTIVRSVLLTAFFLMLHACGGLDSPSASMPAANWQLNNSKSTLSFISTKKNSVAEVHHFKSLSGFLNAEGQAQLDIDLKSVATGIEIRNQRMMEYLFEVQSFAKASVDVDLAGIPFRQLGPGESIHVTVEAKLKLHGASQDLPVAVSVLGLRNGGILVRSSKPIIVNAAVFDLSQGIAKLAELAALPSISSAIPVTFNLLFDPVSKPLSETF